MEQKKQNESSELPHFFSSSYSIVGRDNTPIEFSQIHKFRTHDNVEPDGPTPRLYERDCLRVAVVGHKELWPLAALEPVAPFSGQGRKIEYNSHNGSSK